MTLRVVGVNLSHDSAACLLEDGQVAAALALERITGIKRGVVPAHEYAAAMAALVGDVLSARGLTAGEIDYWIATSTESRDGDDEAALADALGLLVPADRRLVLPHPGHHLAHASAAFYSSGFDEAAALVIDAYGSRIAAGRERESAFHFGAGRPPTVLWRTERAATRIAGRWRDGVLWIPAQLSGIGEIYRVLTLALGFHETGTTYDDAGKTMGLAAYATPLSAEDLFIRIDHGQLRFDHAADALIDLGLAIRREDGLELKARRPDEPIQPFHQQLAAQVQREFEHACLHLADQVLHASRSRALVLSGGCFLNSVVNTRIRRETDCERLFVFPAATDDGNAVGAALYAHHVLLATTPAPAPPAMRHAYLGPVRDLHGIDATAQRWGLRARPGSPARAAAAIARGEIIALFGPRGEFGPRALGARSILCHPGIAGMKDRLNARVKFREAFRPFAAAVLAEHARDWFDLDDEDPFMLRVCPVHPDKRAAISEVVHTDGTCRIQTVDPHLPGPLRELLEQVHALTGVPVVLNTSFNLRGQPIVETPEQALDCLFGSRIDRLFIGDWEIDAPDHTSLRPTPSHPLPSFAVTDHLARAVLDTADGHRTVAALADMLAADLDATLDTALALRARGLLRWDNVPRPHALRLPLRQYEPATDPQ
ncbi:carbamoyltransferase C-terminal domain-containing protein [Nocardia sp. NPDC003482]